MTEAQRDAFRARVIVAMKKMPTEDYRAIRDMMQTEGGQIGSGTSERLLIEDERTVEIALTDAAGEATNVTAEIPKRPRFLGAAPAGVDLEKTGKAAAGDPGQNPGEHNRKAPRPGGQISRSSIWVEFGMTTEDLKKVPRTRSSRYWAPTRSSAPSLHIQCRCEGRSYEISVACAVNPMFDQ